MKSPAALPSRSHPVPTVLSIGGSDSCCGAGIQADLKAFQSLGVYGATVITAITAQNTQNISGIFPIPKKIVSSQLGSVLSDLKPASVKTGMLFSSEIIETVSEKISGIENIVVDPVMVSETGRRLLEEDAVGTLKRKLFPLADLATPNIHEAEVLSGMKISSISDAKKAAKKIPAKSVIIKGGHLPSKTDLLYHKKKFTIFKPSFMFDGRMHGRGCAFSSAVAAGLAKGLELKTAITIAKAFIDRSILNRLSPGAGLPVANSETPARFELKNRIESAAIELSKTNFQNLLPEVGSNLVSLLPGSNEVAGIDGRIRKGKNGILFSNADFGVSTHMASALLCAHSLDPKITSALNFLFTPNIFAACKKAGMRRALADRKTEPAKITGTDGASMPWAVRQVFNKENKIPDIIYHTGSFGKEPLLLLFASSPEAIVVKVKKILGELK